eukprot:jgi/Galph1/5498/GphlegSOOS_G4196.1
MDVWSDDEEVVDVLKEFPSIFVNEETIQDIICSKESINNVDKYQNNINDKRTVARKGKETSGWDRQVEIEKQSNQSSELNICFSNGLLQSDMGNILYQSISAWFSNINIDDAEPEAFVRWSSNKSSLLFPTVYLLSAERLSSLYRNKQNTSKIVQNMEHIMPTQRLEFVIYGMEEWKQRYSSNTVCYPSPDELEQFSISLYITNNIHCLWIDNIQGICTYLYHITKSVEKMVKKGPRDKTLLSEIGNLRKPTLSKSACEVTLRDVYMLLLERCLGRRSKAVERIMEAYPTLFHIRQAICKLTKPEFVKELKSHTTTRQITTKVAEQIYEAFQRDERH